MNLNRRILAVSNTFVAIKSLILATSLLFEAYDVAQPHLQQQLRDQITPLFVTMFADLGVQLQNLEDKIRELEGIES